MQDHGVATERGSPKVIEWWPGTGRHVSNQVSRILIIPAVFVVVVATGLVRGSLLEPILRFATSAMCRASAGQVEMSPFSARVPALATSVSCMSGMALPQGGPGGTVIKRESTRRVVRSKVIVHRLRANRIECEYVLFDENGSLDPRYDPAFGEWRLSVRKGDTELVSELFQTRPSYCRKFDWLVPLSAVGDLTLVAECDPVEGITIEEIPSAYHWSWTNYLWVIVPLLALLVPVLFPSGSSRYLFSTMLLTTVLYVPILVVVSYGGTLFDEGIPIADLGFILSPIPIVFYLQWHAFPALSKLRMPIGILLLAVILLCTVSFTLFCHQGGTIGGYPWAGRYAAISAVLACVLSFSFTNAVWSLRRPYSTGQFILRVAVGLLFLTPTVAVIDCILTGDVGVIILAAVAGVVLGGVLLGYVLVFIFLAPSLDNLRRIVESRRGGTSG